MLIMTSYLAIPPITTLLRCSAAHCSQIMSNLDTLLKSYLDQKHLLEYSGDVLKALERRLTSGEDVVRTVLL
jgi:hypothetical protein